MTEVKKGFKRVSKHYKKGDTSKGGFSSEEILVQGFEVAPAHVELEGGMTLALEGFNSVTFKCSVRLPCYVEEISDAMEEAKRLVVEEVNKQHNQVLATDPIRKGL